VIPDARASDGPAHGAGDRLRFVALLGVVAFVAIVTLEHVLEPSPSPWSHMISEYARTGSRSLMTMAFASWALSLTATAAWLLFRLAPGLAVSRLLAGLLLAAAAGLVAAACFRTQTSAGVLTYGTSMSLGGRLHDAGSGLTTVALFAAAIVSRRLPSITASFGRQVTILVATAVVVDIILLVVGTEVGGLRQRLLVLLACVWQVRMLRLEPQRS
jgi:hypothetical protein